MKKIFSHFRDTMLSGIIFLLPVFVIIVIIQNLYGKLTGFGQQLSSMLGIKTVAGIGAATIGTTILMVVFFYACGLLVKFTMFTNMRSWLENKVLIYIPGYLNYKVKMEEKLLPRTEERVAALIRTGDIDRPGFLVHREKGKCTVFVPDTPDTDSGQVWIVDEHQVKELGRADKNFIDGIRHSGKNLKF